jgi:hypothetical protein
MTDVIQAGIESKGIPYDSGRALPTPVENDAPDVISRGVPDAIEGSSDEALVKESVNALNEKRRKDWESGVGGPDPFESQRNLVDTELRYDGRDTRTKTLREAAKDTSDRHLLDRPEAQIARQQFGFNDEQILAITKDESYLKSLGYTDQEAAAYSRRGELPATKVSPVRHDGTPVPPLDDLAPITERDAFLNRSELKRGMRNFREATAAAQARLLDELTAQQETAADQVAATSSPVDQTPQTRPAVSEPAPTPQQSDPLASERQQLAVARDSYLRASQGSAAEEQAAHQIKVWNAALLKQFPEASNQAAIAELARTNPARAQQLAAAAKKTSDAVSGWMQRGAAATAHRETGERELAALQQAHTRVAWHQYREAHDALAHQRIPELSDPAKASVMRSATRQMLRDVGFQEGEVSSAWNGEGGLSLRDGRVQQVIADAVRWRQAQAKKNLVMKAPVPPVQKPGVYRAAGSGDFETVQRLQKQLETASGNAAVKLATKLHQARRQAGM